MAPWTFVGSLIAFFKKNRSANFYVEIYGVFYAMGTPTSIFQQRYDTYWDMKFGSARTYLLRGQLNFVVQLAVVLVMPLVLLNRWLMLVSMAVLGVSSWMLHGTACMLASMCSKAGAISALQTGFRTPEILAILACYSLDIGSRASQDSLRAFFVLIAALVVTGLVAWTVLLFHPSVRSLLHEKDLGTDKLDLPAARPLLGTSSSTDESPPPQRTQRIKTAYAAADDPSEEEALLQDDVENDLDDDDNDNDTQTPVVVGTPTTTTTTKEDAVTLLSMTEMDHIATLVRPCRVALFYTMFGSIFTAAFFAYANSTRGIDIEQVLYFTRLFGDLLGRPFTSLPRPRWLQTPRQLAVFAILRLVLSVLFFMYVFVPGVPQSDAIIVADIALFSVSSGYVGILAYEMAARDLKNAAAKSYATSLMNTTFQVSMLLAVLLGILISEIIS